MKIRKILAASALALSGALVAISASAQPYVGASLGKSDISEDIAAGLITSGSVDGKDTGWKIFGGYMFNKYVGVEGAYVNLGEASYSGTLFGVPVTGGRVEVTGFNVAGVGSYPVTEQFSVFGKLGLMRWEAEANDITGGVPFSDKVDGSDFFFGLGVGFNFTRNLAVRAEWERFKIEDADASLVSVGLLWRF